MKTTFFCAAVIVLLSTAPSLCGEYLMNDTGLIATGLQILFSEPVTLDNFGDIFTKVEPTGPSTKFTFSVGEVSSWEGQWLNWTPQEAIIESTQWLISYHIPGQSQEPELPIELSASSSTDPDTYLYVPKIDVTPAEKKCYDCKTYAIVAVMRYYGEDVEFADICREVGEPPGACFAGVRFFGDLIAFVESRGFVFEAHHWNVDQIIKQIEAGRPVIASHRIGDMPAEPGIVKGFSDSRVWVWGIWEHITQRDQDSLYTYQQFQTLLAVPKDPETGIDGYLPWLWRTPRNCYLVYKPGVTPSRPTYPLHAVSYSTRLERSRSGGPGVVHVLNVAGDGEMSWDTALREGESTEIRIRIYNSDYVTGEPGSPSVRFAVRFVPDASDVGNAIKGYSQQEKWLHQNLFGYIFEEVLLSVTCIGNTWIGSVEICPNVSVESLYVLGAPHPTNTPYFGYEVEIEMPSN